MPIDITPDRIPARTYPYLAIRSIWTQFDVETGKTLVQIVYQKFDQDADGNRTLSPVGAKTIRIDDFDAFATDKANAGDNRFTAMGQNLLAMCAELAIADATGGTPNV
jgi:hypothetical protein